MLKYFDESSRPIIYWFLKFWCIDRQLIYLYDDIKNKIHTWNFSKSLSLNTLYLLIMYNIFYEKKCRFSIFIKGPPSRSHRGYGSLYIFWSFARFRQFRQVSAVSEVSEFCTGGETSFVRFRQFRPGPSFGFAWNTNIH